LGEHRELHALWVILTKDKKGFARHPETVRWRGKLAALYRRHEALVAEMEGRGYRHRTPLPTEEAVGLAEQREYKDTRRSRCGFSGPKAAAAGFRGGRAKDWQGLFDYSEEAQSTEILHCAALCSE